MVQNCWFNLQAQVITDKKTWTETVFFDSYGTITCFQSFNSISWCSTNNFINHTKLEGNERWEIEVEYLVEWLINFIHSMTFFCDKLNKWNMSDQKCLRLKIIKAV